MGLKESSIQRAIRENPVTFFTGLGAALASGACYAIADHQTDSRTMWRTYGVAIGLDVLALLFFTFTFKDAVAPREDAITRRWSPYGRR